MNLKRWRFDVDWGFGDKQFCEDGCNIDCDHVLDFISQMELRNKTPEEIIAMLKEGLA